MPINYPWNKIDKMTADKDGLKVYLEAADEEKKPKEEETEGEKSEVGAKPYSYPKSIATDSVSIAVDIGKAVINDDTGVMIIPDVVVATEMIQDYDGSQVLKTATEIKRCIALMDHKPITNNHPVHDYVTSPDEIKGFMFNPWFDYDSNQVFVDLQIDCTDLQKEIQEEKKREVSLGFQYDVVEDSGEFNGNAYEFKHENLYVDHLAIVENGRCSLKDGFGIPSETLAQAKQIVGDKKDELAGEIEKRSKGIKKKDLVNDSLDKLKKDLTYLNRIEAESKTAEKLSGRKKSEKDMRTLIDDAYAKVGV